MYKLFEYNIILYSMLHNAETVSACVRGPNYNSFSFLITRADFFENYHANGKGVFFTRVVIHKNVFVIHLTR